MTYPEAEKLMSKHTHLIGQFFYSDKDEEYIIVSDIIIAPASDLSKVWELYNYYNWANKFALKSLGLIKADLDVFIVSELQGCLTGFTRLSELITSVVNLRD